MTWLSKATQINVGIGGLSGGQNLLFQTTNGWHPESYSNQIGTGLTLTEVASADSLFSSVAWSDYPPTCCLGQSQFARIGNFQVTGTGNITFVLDYSLVVDRSVPVSFPQRFISSGNAFVALFIEDQRING
jgi:hypothetical protein